MRQSRLTNVILTNVDSLDTGSQSYIYSIIDEKRNICRLGHSMESFGNANLLASVASLVTQLDNCDTCEKNVRSEVVVVGL